MNEESLEKLRQAANTNWNVRFGEQSIKRKTQLQQYYRDKIVYNEKEFILNFSNGIINSINSVITFFNKLMDDPWSSLNKK